MSGTVRGRYQVLATAGAGAQGEVVQALDHQHERLVAVKVRTATSERDRQALLSEARVLLKLRPHPGVSLVREDFFEGDRYYLVMDWVEGVDLGRRLAQAGPEGLPFPVVLGYLSQVADALDHLHGHDPPIVHKDVKPANIVIDTCGRAVLVDFGISGTQSRPQPAAAGTAGYVAPEVCAGQPATSASDVFSLAATAFYALTGCHPEPGCRPRWRGVPESQLARVQTAMARGLAFIPERRPRSARELVELLRPAAVPTNLPAPLTSFVGRHRELTELTDTLEHSRLVTLTGVGGVGKTRLALEAAGRLAWSYPDGAFLAELAPVARPGLVPQAVAAALGIPERPGQAMADTLADSLQARRLLVILDNCEHVVDAAAALAESLLAACPGLRILATSREPLELFGEAVRPVAPLGVPEAGVPPATVQLGSYEAVELFCDRARAADPCFALNVATAGAVAQICVAVDGIPLALEMAAARLAEFPLDELAGGLSRALELRGRRTAPSRQRTLAAAIAWSYELLDEQLRMLFRRLSAFAGGFEPDAAMAVCADERLPQEAVATRLGALVAKSLVVALAPPRHRLLEPLRVYAAERLAEAGEADAVSDRHLQWCLAAAEELEPKLYAGGDPRQALDRLERRGGGRRRREPDRRRQPPTRRARRVGGRGTRGPPGRHPDPADAARGARSRVLPALSTGEAHVLGEQLQLPVLRRDGTEIPCSVMVEQVPGGGGETTTWRGSSNGRASESGDGL